MTDLWTDKLSEYLDGELPAQERTALEAHLGTCPVCRETLAELRAVTAEAQRLPNPVPARDLWAGIAAEIGAERRTLVLRPRWSREVRIALPQLLAASLALMLLSGGGVWLAMQRMPGHAPVGAGSNPAPIASSQTPAMGTTDLASADHGTRLASAESPRYDATIAELQKILSDGRGTLDTSTVRVLEQNLAIIDRAVEQARRAVAADPANPYLRSHLAATMKRKVDLLRMATELTNAPQG